MKSIRENPDGDENTRLTAENKRAVVAAKRARIFKHRVPAGCTLAHGFAPGYILDVFDGSAWMTQDGQVTTEWGSRGIWQTIEEAQAAMDRFLHE